MRTVAVRGTIFVLMLTGFAACSTSRPASQPVRFTGESVPATGDPFPNWPEPPEIAIEILRTSRLEVVSVEGAGAGTTGARKVEMRCPEVGAHLKMKGKRVPPSLDGINNSPRKELAAWELQRLFLDPADYTVPATAARCVPMELWRRYHEAGEPTLPGSNCALIVLAVWLNNVTVPDALYDDERFLTDRAYAYHLANFNIFAYLINLRDNRTGNVLVGTDEERRRVFAIDNGVAFGTAWFNWFWPPTYAWRQIRVPALPRGTIDRLRELRREDLDVLLVVQQLDLDERGVFETSEPGPPLDPDEGARHRGSVLQFGLTEDEVGDVWERIEALLAKVDAGEIALF